MNSRGVTLVEIIVAAAIVLTLTGAVIGAYISYMDHFRGTTKRIQAAYLLEEGAEAVKILRSKSWSNNIAPLATDDRHFLAFDRAESTWHTTTTPEWINGTFKRWFVLKEVTRNGQDDISDSGSIDDGTRKVNVHVAWSTGDATSTRTIHTYITDLYDN